MTYEGSRWVSAADAADAAGVIPEVVREWASSGLIASQRSRGLVAGQVMVRRGEVIEQANATSQAAFPSFPPDPEASTLPGLELAPILKTMAQLTTATDRAVRAEMKVEILNQQLKSSLDWVRGVGGVAGTPNPRS